MKGPTEGQEWPDNVRGRLHHMFGFACRRRANYELNNPSNDKPDLTKVMEIIKKAVQHFKKGRKYAVNNRSYGYIGEVRVRLLLVEHVEKAEFIEYPKGCAEAFSGEMDRKSIQLSEFIRESHSACDQLLAECQRYTPEAELRGVKDFAICVDKFVTCFQKVLGKQTFWEKSSSNLSVRRSRIASLKMQYHKENGKTPCVDDIDQAKHVRELVELYEETFRQVLANDMPSVLISYDILEWLEAIRHQKIQDSYTLIKVLPTVESWERRNEVGYATYYLYILYFLLAMYTPGPKVGLNFHDKAEEMRKKLKSTKHRQVNIRLTREWLADHKRLTIRKLICRSKLGVWDNTTRFWKDSAAVKRLKVCTGIIIKSSHKQEGIIKLDVPNRKLRQRIDVSYYPAFYKLFGNRYSEQSIPVEFFIGFSVERGAEALSVKMLQQTFCSHCKLNTRVITLNQDGGGICNKCQNPVDINQTAA